MPKNNFYALKYATPKGSQLSCKGWIQEAALRIMLSNLNIAAAQFSDQPAGSAGQGAPAINHAARDSVMAVLRVLENDETLIIQNGNPLGIMKTHKDVPRILIGNSRLAEGAQAGKVEKRAETGSVTGVDFTTGLWLNAGTNGFIQENYETYAAIAGSHFNGTLKGTLNVSAGLGVLGCAQPAAITMNEGVALIAETDEGAIDKCISLKYLDVKISDIDKAIDYTLEAKAGKRAISIGVLCNAVHLLGQLLKRGIIPDTITDQTPARDPLKGYCPHQMDYEYSKQLLVKHPHQYLDYALDSIVCHVKYMQELQDKGAITFDSGNEIRTRASERVMRQTYNFQGFVSNYTRPDHRHGKGPFCWSALSGDLTDMATTDELMVSMFSENKGLVRWLKKTRVTTGCGELPVRICWLSPEEREKAGLAFNELVRTAKVRAPVIISRDHLSDAPAALQTGSSRSMTDNEVTIGDMPILSALVSTAGGASWVSLDNGTPGTGVHTNIAIVADGTVEAGRRLSRVLGSEPGMEMIRPVETAIDNNNQPIQRKYTVNVIDRLLLSEVVAW